MDIFWDSVMGRGGSEHSIGLLLDSVVYRYSCRIFARLLV